GFQGGAGRQLGKVDAGLGGCAHHRTSCGHADRNAGYAERDALRGNAGGCAEITLAGNDSFQHEASSLQAAVSTAPAVGPKSSGKCFNAESTGYGAMPPSAHSEPPNMVSHRS